MKLAAHRQMGAVPRRELRPDCLEVTLARSAHHAPMLVRPDGSSTHLQQTILGETVRPDSFKQHRESFLQKLVFRCPQAIPMSDIERALTPMVPICMELPINGTSLDNLWMTPTGGIILGECKLVRNPQSRREVLVQALDYASALSGWSYEDLERAVGTRTNGAKLWDLVKHLGDDSPDAEAEFADAVQRRLRDGQFLILLILDGVQDGLEHLHAYLQQHAGLHVNLAIVELSLWSGLGDDLLVVPRVPLKTQLVERGIVVNAVGGGIKIVEPRSGGPQSLPKPFTASEAEFYDRLEHKVPGVREELKAFLASLEDCGITPEFQRAAILRWTPSPDQEGSVGYVDAYGSAWLGDGYYSARKFGNEAAGRAYMEDVARAIGGKVKWPEEGNSQLTVRGKSGKTVRIDELLERAEAWKAAIRKLTRSISGGPEGEGSQAAEVETPLDDRTCLEVLASFAPRFRELRATPGATGSAGGADRSGGSAGAAPYQDSEVARDFNKAMYLYGWVSSDFDYTEWMDTPEAQELRSSPAAIRNATPDQLLMLMTVLMRGEHWMEGYLADKFESGVLSAAAERAAAILEEGGPYGGRLKHISWP